MKISVLDSDEFERDFEELAFALAEFRAKYLHPHETIVGASEGVRIVEDEAFRPTRKKDEAA